MPYERYHVDPLPVPPRKEEPFPYFVHVDKLGLLEAIAKEAMHYGPRLLNPNVREALLSRPCVYGVFQLEVSPFKFVRDAATIAGRYLRHLMNNSDTIEDGVTDLKKFLNSEVAWQGIKGYGGITPQRSECTACRRCEEEYPELCRVEVNPKLLDFNDPYLVPSLDLPIPLLTILKEASTGKIPVRGMGFRGKFAGEGWDSIWTDMSEIVRPTRDGVYGREFISTVVDVGRREPYLQFNAGNLMSTSRTFEIPLPLAFDYLPPNLNNPDIQTSIAEAARRLGTFFIAAPDEMPAALLSETYARSFVPLLGREDIDRHADLIAQAPMVEFKFGRENLAEQVRKHNPDAIISARVAARPGIEKLATELANNGVDVIHVFANYHGREFGSPTPRYLKDVLLTTHTALRDQGIRENITVGASGGIILAEHMAKAILCGADFTFLDTTVLAALQYEFEGPCVTPFQSRIQQESIDLTWGANRLVNVGVAGHDQLIEILGAMGMREVRHLRGDTGRGIFHEELEERVLGDIRV